MIKQSQKIINFYKIDEYGSNLTKEIYNANSTISGPDDYFEGIIRKQNELVVEFNKNRKLMEEKKKRKLEREKEKEKERENEEDNIRNKKKKSKKRRRNQIYKIN